MAYFRSIIPFITQDELTEEQRSFQRVFALRKHDTLSYAWESFCCQSMEDVDALKAKLGGEWKVVDNRRQMST